jgi:DNA polymerase-1
MGTPTQGGELCEDHRAYLAAAGISEAMMSCARSEPGAMVFTLGSITGRCIEQRRPDDPGDGPKYLTAAGEQLVLPVPPGFTDRVNDPAIPLLIVEGTKGHLAAASALADTSIEPYAVVGVLGCNGWSRQGHPIDDLHAIPLANRHVILLFDADMAANRNVYDAATHLAEVLTVVGGAASVKYAKFPGSGKASIDDVLGCMPDPQGRAQVMRRIITNAKATPGRAPAARTVSADWLVANNGRALNSPLATKMLLDKYDMALAPGNHIVVYQDGKYHNGQSLKFEAAVQELLGTEYQQTHLRTLTDTVSVALKQGAMEVPEFQHRLLIPFRNGLLDPDTMVLHPHDPEFRTMRQFDVAWDPQGTAPFYEQWAGKHVGVDILDDLEECASAMLDMTGPPAKAMLLFGPSRSGKGTYMRLIEAAAGPLNVSAVSLHTLASNRFATADLYGKTANVHADLSADEVRDLSQLKLALGEDYLRAERKFGQPFTFRNTALMVFGANTIPPVSESSQAYFARVKPFEFPTTFLGHEDPTVGERLLAELPGIMVRWVTALNRRRARGAYLPTDPATDAKFRHGSDRVAQYIEENYTRTGWMKRSTLWDKFKRDSETNRTGQAMGKKTFFERLRNIGVVESRRNGIQGFQLTPRDPDAAQGQDRAPQQGRKGRTEPTLPLIGDTAQFPVSVTNGKGRSDSALSAPTPLVLDLETADADRLHDYGDGFIRLIGTPTGMFTDPVSVCTHPGPLVAHNGFSFDFVALAVHANLDLLAHDLIDTVILDLLDDPLPAGTFNPGQVLKHLSLDQMAQRRTGMAKTDNIKRLAATHGGFDRIPIDDPDYRAYCAGDVAATQAILASMPALDDYARRELTLMARLSSAITVGGFKVDETLLAERLAANDADRAAGRARLVDRYGLPASRRDGTPALNPLATAEGKQRIEDAFRDIGVELPRTTSGLQPRLDKATMAHIVATGTPTQRDLAQLVLDLNGVRTIYSTLHEHTHNGRVHPTVLPSQASGRMSLTNPGLTVLGKRGQKVAERAILLPEEGHVLIAADLAQIDARAIAAHSQDPNYLALFDTGLNPATGKEWDAHAEIALMVWGDRARRNDAKAIGHGWNYGMGLTKIADTTGLPLLEAEKFDAAMRERFPQVVHWRDHIRDLGASGELLDNGFGRKMRPTPERAYTQAPALMGQGTARDLMMEGILRLPQEMIPMLRVIVHDEVILSVPEDIVEDVEHQLLEALQFQWAPPGAQRAITVRAGLAKRGRNWAHCYR